MAAAAAAADFYEPFPGAFSSSLSSERFETFSEISSYSSSSSSSFNAIVSGLGLNAIGSALRLEGASDSEVPFNEIFINLEI